MRKISLSPCWTHIGTNHRVKKNITERETPSRLAPQKSVAGDPPPAQSIRQNAPPDQFIRKHSRPVSQPIRKKSCTCHTLRAGRVRVASIAPSTVAPCNSDLPSSTVSASALTAPFIGTLMTAFMAAIARPVSGPRSGKLTATNLRDRAAASATDSSHKSRKRARSPFQTREKEHVRRKR